MASVGHQERMQRARPPRRSLEKQPGADKYLSLHICSIAGGDYTVGSSSTSLCVFSLTDGIFRLHPSVLKVALYMLSNPFDLELGIARLLARLLLCASQ
jgi:hypothetical protein